MKASIRAKLTAQYESWPEWSWWYARFCGAAKATITDEQAEAIMATIEKFRTEDEIDKANNVQKGRTFQ
jgi:hypothetical protein